jgi:hypothetical protein
MNNKNKSALNKRRTNAAKKIQKAWGRRNVITSNRIGSKPYALWNRSGGRGLYNIYSLNTLSKLNINPFSRIPKKSKNIIMRGGLHKVKVAPLKNNNNNRYNNWNNNNNNSRYSSRYYRNSYNRPE